jgi:hypothetical protein
MIDAAKTRLLSDERIVWESRPYAGIILRPIDVFLIPFSIAWAGFALFWNISAGASGAGLPFQLFGLPFLVAGLYATVGRFLLDILIRKNTRYFVTNKRILITSGTNGSKLKSLDITRLPSLELDERRDGSGTLRFGPSGGWFGGGNNFAIWQPTFDPTPQFIRVAQARSVYELIHQQADA